ncbi:MAG: MarR family winged helix-turn-helix transcriptional regulator [Chloroflexota bacterium]|nr:MarR family winged helix-turn-helix transcriptional regulator [Chloroflexota bacterium]
MYRAAIWLLTCSKAIWLNASTPPWPTRAGYCGATKRSASGQHEAAGLEPRQYQLLLMVRGLAPTGQASVSELADWLQVRHHSAVGLVDRMGERGLVERHADSADGRRVLIKLTQAGRAALSRLALQHRDELRSLAPSLIEALQQAVSMQHTVATGER